ncbi:MAG: hypothetical protein Q7S05_05260 [bacterium]|nr:hypothetical protein [bacterium]
MDENIMRFPSPLDRETQQLLSSVEKTQRALREARMGTGNLKEPDEKAENELGMIENQMKNHAKKLRGGKPDAEFSGEIRLQIMVIRATLTDYLTPGRIEEIFGTDKI